MDIVDLLACAGLPDVPEIKYSMIVLLWFPVMVVSRGRKVLMVNIHEFCLNSNSFCDLLMLSENVTGRQPQGDSNSETCVPTIQKADSYQLLILHYVGFRQLCCLV